MNSSPSTSGTSTSAYAPLVSFAQRTAQDPKYAYGLSALFWASVPVSFLAAHSDAMSSSSLIRPATAASASASASAANASKTPLAKALDAHSFDTVKSQGAKAASAAAATPLRGGLAPFWQLAGIGSLVGLGGYITSQGDPLNGAGTVTAWSLLYLAFHGYPSLRAGKPWPIALTLSTAIAGAGIHGIYYFDRTSWRGAIPAISQPQPQQQRSTSTIQQSSSALPALMLLSAALGGRRAAAAATRTRSSAASIMSQSLRHSSSSAASSKATRFVHPIDPATIPRGFAAAYGYAGIKAAISPKPVPDAASHPTSSSSSTPKPSPKPDLALIVSTTPHPAAAAGTFTRNVFKAAPVVLSSDIVSRVGKARSVLINSGCANAVTGQKGLDDAKRCDELVGKLLGNEGDKTVLLSTGVIGVPLPMQAIEGMLPELAGQLKGSEELKGEALAKAWHETSRAFMTTDTFPKLRTRVFELEGREYRMLGIDKGAGMIHPNMAGPSSSGALHATLLGFIATDAPITPSALQSALNHAVSRSFNCISVDGDMSTNDTILALANNHCSLPESKLLTTDHPAYAAFEEELTSFCIELAQLVVRDGEGAEKFVEVNVKGAPDWETAHAVAGSISTSALVKCALHGGDANWGRILCAVGYAKLPASSEKVQGWSIDPMKVTVRFLPPPSAEGKGNFEPLVVLKDGAPQPVDEEEAARLLALEDIVIEVDLQGGAWAGGAKAVGEEEGSASYWTCDFSKEYVAINGDYRS